LRVFANFDLMKTTDFINVKRLIASKNPKLAKFLPGFITSYLERILHQDEINEFIRNHHDKFDQDFAEEIMRYFNITVVIKNKERIPKEGPVILAMNHPLGGMDAVAFIAGMRDHRKDLRFIVNDLLMSLTNLKNLFVGVNKHGKNDLAVREQIQQTFESNHAVCIFPAGLVSRRIKGEVQDLAWKKTFMIYARSLNRTVVPIYIDGELSNFFYKFYQIRKSLGIKANLEMLYLSDELFQQRNRTITFTVGEPILASSIPANMSDKSAAEMVKKAVHQLKFFS
jgi:putative hemolysin